PSHLIVALWIGCGLRELGALAARSWRRFRIDFPARRRLALLFGAVSLCLPLLLVSLNWHAIDQRRDRDALHVARSILDALKPNAVLLAGGDDWWMPVIYTQYVERRRPDVILIPLQDMAIRGHFRLVKRFASPQLRVRAPADYFAPR